MSGAALIGGALSGALIGSAAGVALHRWPAGDTLRNPQRSHCSTCRSVLRSRDLVPVVSWLMLRGRCRSCESPIDARLPALELASAVGVALTLHVRGIGWESALLALGVVAVLLGTLTDLQAMIVPDRLTLPLGALSVIGMSSLATDTHQQRHVLVWGLAVPLAFSILARTVERFAEVRPIGGGDVKLLVGVLALATAVDGGAIAVVVLAVLLAGTVGIVGLATGRLERRDRIPFAPAIAGGFLTVVLVPSAAARVASIVGFS
jgi:leader peptidase (prepilin peptidase) / N-methyltransferase